MDPLDSSQHSIGYTARRMRHWEEGVQEECGDCMGEGMPIASHRGRAWIRLYIGGRHTGMWLRTTAQQMTPTLLTQFMLQ